MTVAINQSIQGSILIIDDKPMSIQLLMDMLIRSGHRAYYVADGEEALATIHSTLPDLILLDVIMPVMDGYTLCAQIKSDPATADIPIIFISGYGEVIDRVRGFSVGGADYITKPFHTQEVLARIDHQLMLQYLKRDLEAQNLRLHLEVNHRLQAETEVRILLQSMTDIILVFDRQGQHLRTVPTNCRFSAEVQEKYYLVLSEQVEHYRDFIRIAVESHDNVCDVEYALTLGTEETWFSANVSPMSADTVIWVAREITSRKTIEASLTRINSFLNAQKEVAQDGVLMVDNQGRIISYNQLFLTMWGLEESLLRADEHRLIAAFLHKSKVPEALIEAIEAMYQTPENPLHQEIGFGDQIFDCYARSVLSPTGKFYGVSWFFRDITDRVRAEAVLQAEKEKSEKLLLNVLPATIAQRLKENTHTIAEAYPAASVLFADIVGFSAIAAQAHPAEVVELLNGIFSEFDALAEKHTLEKIKTIGDEYMVVGGLPTPHPQHLRSAALMSLDMLNTIGKFSHPGGTPLTLRVGIHCGPVVAGVIGTKKFSYDLWGDTVNLASRMESQGAPGKIQVTERVYHELHPEGFRFQYRGNIPIKGHGSMATYWLLP